MQNPQETTHEDKKMSKRERLVHAGVMLGAVLALFIIAWLVTRLGSGGEQPASAAPAPVSSANPQLAASVTSEPEGLDDGNWNRIGPVEQQESMELIDPDYRMIALPENGRVDMKYFDTVTFVGDSLTQGFQIYDSAGIHNAKYAAYKSISPKGIYDGTLWEPWSADDSAEKELPLDKIVATAPDNVYILMGANAMTSAQDDAIIAYYREMLNQIKSRLAPQVGIYVQSITPVTAEAKFDMVRISGLNNQLAKLAYELGVYFLDLNEPLADDTGYLRADFAASDGIHLTPAGYTAWKDYLVTHTAYHPRNPYLEGSPAYTPPAPPEPAVPEGEAPVEEVPPAEGEALPA